MAVPTGVRVRPPPGAPWRDGPEWLYGTRLLNERRTDAREFESRSRRAWRVGPERLYGTRPESERRADARGFESHILRHGEASRVSDDGSGFENRRARKRLVGPSPTLSAARPLGTVRTQDQVSAWPPCSLDAQSDWRRNSA
jgi:hypothetical protein